jgi:flagellar basal-body rod protein FlgG
MNISFYTAKTGVIAQQQGMNIYANNIANINTIGYKPLRPSFAECIYTLQHHNRPQWQTGHGQYAQKTDLMWEQGQFVLTDQPLDYALPCDSFFMIRDGNGDEFLTRDGGFKVSNTGDVWELVNGWGDFVLDYEGNRITVPFVIDGNGNVTTDIDYDALSVLIGVYSVDNNWGLDQSGNNRFVITERSGEAVANINADKVRGALELSATDLAGDMVRIIETQRSYQLNARIVRISDEMMTTINSLR